MDKESGRVLKRPKHSLSLEEFQSQVMDSLEFIKKVSPTNKSKDKQGDFGDMLSGEASGNYSSCLSNISEEEKEEQILQPSRHASATPLEDHLLQKLNSKSKCRLKILNSDKYDESEIKEEYEDVKAQCKELTKGMSPEERKSLIKEAEKCG